MRLLPSSQLGSPWRGTFCTHSPERQMACTHSLSALSLGHGSPSSRTSAVLQTPSMHVVARTHGLGAGIRPRHCPSALQKLARVCSLPSSHCDPMFRFSYVQLPRKHTWRGRRAGKGHGALQGEQ